jgi:hypothetical protein
MRVDDDLIDEKVFDLNAKNINKKNFMNCDKSD